MNFSTFITDYGTIITNYVTAGTVCFALCYGIELNNKITNNQKVNLVRPFILALFSVIISTIIYRWSESDRNYKLPFEYKIGVATLLAILSGRLLPAVQSKKFDKFLLNFLFGLAGDLGKKAGEALKEAEAAEQKDSKSKEEEKKN